METYKLIYLILFIQIFSFFFILFSFLYKENTIINRFITKINVLSDFLIGTGIILTYLLFRNTYNKTIIDTTLSMNDDFIKIHKEFSDNYDKCPNFISSLKFKFQDESNNNDNDNDQNENQITINYISNLIFSSIEDYLVSSSMNKTSDSVTISSFLSYFSSKRLRSQWNVMKFNYQTQTKMLIELLIKSIKENKFNNSDEVNNFCDKLILTSYFDKILKFKDKTVISLE